MQLIKELIVIDKSSRTPVYLQIANAIIQGIHQGKLRKDLRLPGARRMADLLQVNRLTVAAALRELELQGWVEMLPRKGAVVKVSSSVFSPKHLVDDLKAFQLPEEPGFTYEEINILPYYSPDFPPSGKLFIDAGFPDTRLAPIEDLVRSIRSFARRSFNKKYLTYGGSQGSSFLRYDFHYAGKPMMPMASLDQNGNVIYIGTLSKSLAPAIRVGFMVAPERFIRSATLLRKSIDTQGDSLIENAIAELYKDGSIARHVKRSVKLYKERRDHFCALLKQELGDRVSFKLPEGGMSVWAHFVHDSLPVVVEKAYKKGLILSDGTDYDTGRIKYNSTCLGFASLTPGEQERAVGVLREVLDKG